MILFSSFRLNFEWKQRVSHLFYIELISSRVSSFESENFYRTQNDSGNIKSGLVLPVSVRNSLEFDLLTNFRSNSGQTQEANRKRMRKNRFLFQFCFPFALLSTISMINLLSIYYYYRMVKFVMYLFASLVKMNQNEIWVEHWTIYK